MFRRPRSPPAFPYTTLFRSAGRRARPPALRLESPVEFHAEPETPQRPAGAGEPGFQVPPVHAHPAAGGPLRSEEHTSELQSLTHTASRLLLAKIQTNYYILT